MLLSTPARQFVHCYWCCFCCCPLTRVCVTFSVSNYSLSSGNNRKHFRLIDAVCLYCIPCVCKHTCKRYYVMEKREVSHRDRVTMSMAIISEQTKRVTRLYTESASARRYSCTVVPIIPIRHFQCQLAFQFDTWIELKVSASTFGVLLRI